MPTARPFASPPSATCTTRRPRRASLQPLFAQITEQRRRPRASPATSPTTASPRRRRCSRATSRRSVKIPIVAVLGNHDYECGQAGRGRARSSPTPACTCSTATPSRSLGVGFAGVKGFAGGFGRGALGPWGEPIDQAVRAGGAARGAQARVGARAAHHAPPDRRAALRADPRHGRGRAGGDLSRGSGRAGSRSRSRASR